MKNTILIICLVLFSFTYSRELVKTAQNAKSKTESLKILQDLVNNPEQARKMRKEIENASYWERKKWDELGEFIEKEIKTISSSLPFKVDEYTTALNVAVVGKHIAYNYSLDIGYGNKDKIMKDMEKMITNNFCSSPMAAWLLIGYEMSFFYYSLDGVYLGGVIIDANTCGF